ncbi:nuclear transport factor 2 family protein [Streptomyces sp. LN590]|uniref:nuclear transport factor 2 family protein n=1 Tax=unclassified Streptomyces TaxID=2593676 RepID=UPI003712D7D1
MEAVGREIASIGRHGRWPDDAETDSYGVAKYDGVEVLFNCDDVNWLQPADHHTVFVHVDKWGDLPRADKLAAYLGSTPWAKRACIDSGSLTVTAHSTDVLDGATAHVSAGAAGVTLILSSWETGKWISSDTSVIGGNAVGDQETRAALDRHWAASAAGDQDAEHEIYHDDVITDYPQSGERIHGRRNLQALRSSHPAKLTFTIRRILGSGDLWITEYVIDYDGKPASTISIMEFRDGKVAHETQYFADPFNPPAWRAGWVESMPFI